MDARTAKKPAAVVTRLRDGAAALSVDGRPIVGSLPVDTGLAKAIAKALSEDKGRVLAHPDGEIFINVFNPPLRMIIIGAVHIAQSLAPMARIAGFEVAVIDPRGAWATPERFPGVTLERDWPDEVMAKQPPDSRTAVVALTHDPKLDDPALSSALQSDAFYIGALGSRKTHAARLERLHGAGIEPSSTERIAGPVGLDIGASSPAEVAVAILAQAILSLRGAKADRTKG